MGNAPHGYTTPLESSLDCLKMLVQRKLFAEKKDEFALVLCGTEATSNELADDDGNFEHISVVRDLGRLDWDLIEYLNKDIEPQTTDETADIIDALMVGADILVKYTEGKKGIGAKRLVLFSNLDGVCNKDDLGRIAKRLKKAEIELLFVGSDLGEDDEADDEDGEGEGGGDDDDGNDGKPKSENQLENEATMKLLVRALNGTSWSFDEAIPTLSYFETRGVSQRPWPVEFEISENLHISIKGYTKVKFARQKTMKAVYAMDPDEPITSATSFHKLDEAETEVDESETVKGFRYGNTLVPFSEEDQANMKLTAVKCLKLLCFTSADNIPRSFFMGDSVSIFVADPDNASSQRALSAIIHALYERNSVAVVRRVYSRAAAPQIGALIPKIKADYEALEYVALPFAEDVRRFTFGSLPVNADEENDMPPQVQKFKPSPEQLSAIDRLISTMDIGKERCLNELDCGEELLKPSQNVNPYIQHFYSCAADRALDPSAPIPEPRPSVTVNFQPPAVIAASADSVAEQVQELFPLKRREDKKKKRTADSMFGNEEEEEEGAKVPRLEENGAELSEVLRVVIDHVGSVDPISDFRAILAQGHLDQAIEQMERRIDQLVTDSFGDQFYPKAMDCLRALREECIKWHQSKKFNTFMREWKVSLQNGTKRPFWDKIVKDHVTLISNAEDKDSDIPPSDAEAFLPQDNEEPPEKKTEDADEEDIDDLLDDME